MSIRFRKVFSLGGLLRLNISKTGIGVGVGPRGFSLSIGSKGIRRSVGIPGSGLSYQDATSWKKLNEVADTPTEEINSNADNDPAIIVNSSSGINLWKIAFFLLAGMAFIWHLNTLKQKAANEQAPSPEITQTVNRSLTSTEIRELQTLLNQKGYQAGSADGVNDSKTRVAVKVYLKTKGLNQAVDFDLRLLNQMLRIPVKSL